MKLVLREADSQEARTTVTNGLKKGFQFFTVDVALAEGLNAIWKHVNVVKDLQAEEGTSAIDDLLKVHDRLNIISSREIAEEAAKVAFTQNVAFYDSLYVAATQKLNGTLYTADQKLCESARKEINVKLLKAKTTQEAQENH